jgi:hypothetical protein
MTMVYWMPPVHPPLVVAVPATPMLFATNDRLKLANDAAQVSIACADPKGGERA